MGFQISYVFVATNFSRPFLQSSTKVLVFYTFTVSSETGLYLFAVDTERNFKDFLVLVLRQW